MLLAGAEGQIERTWRAALVWLPGAVLPDRPDVVAGPMQELEPAFERIPSAVSLPLVVYAHGCAGLDDEARAWGERLARQGQAVIAPDSFARGWRRPCPAPARPGAPDVLPERGADLAYALRQAQTLTWVRKNAVLLFGSGEGAATVARYNGPPLAAYVLTGWTCDSLFETDALRARLRRPVHCGPEVETEASRRAALDFVRRLAGR